MNGTIAIPDPTAALMLTAMKGDELGQMYHGSAGARAALRRRRRRFEHAARLRRLLA